MLRKYSADRRTQKTRKALQEALISLMFEKSYDAILIQEILDRANIGRSTFYTHFRDKDELLVEGLQNLRKILRDAQLATPVASNMKYERVIGFSLAMFEHVHSHKKLYRALVGGPGWVMVRQHMEDMLVQLMKEEARSLFKRKGTSEVPFELFIHFLGATIMSVLTWWLNFRRPPPPTEINALFRELVIPTLTAHLN
jgi:AcrR family transcriptional regulator